MHGERDGLAGGQVGIQRHAHRGQLDGPGIQQRTPHSLRASGGCRAGSTAGVNLHHALALALFNAQRQALQPGGSSTSSSRMRS